MKTKVKIIRRPWKGNAVDAVVEVSGPKARELVAVNRAELVAGEPSPQLRRVSAVLEASAVKKTARKTAVKKTVRKNAAKKTTEKTVRGKNRSMDGKTATK